MPEVSGPDAAKILGIDQSTVRRYIYRGLLKARRSGLRKIIKVDLDELRRFAAEHEYRFNEELAGEYSHE
ncbi:MAG: helix-turn-helix domain-containing protein [Caldilineaceae bacterium]